MNPSVDVREKPRPGDQIRAARRLEPAEDIAPAAVRKTAAVSPRLQLPRQATCRTTTPVPAAARRVSSATSALPGRVSLSGSSG